ncbi:MAG: hypothetical protein HC860_25455, partial [Alkalinema sp. RU_4_3]|nr:hypothetical protein [Alkalinema sp. RU_4_3]
PSVLWGSLGSGWWWGEFLGGGVEVLADQEVVLKGGGFLRLLAPVVPGGGMVRVGDDMKSGTIRFEQLGNLTEDGFEVAGGKFFELSGDGFDGIYGGSRSAAEGKNHATGSGKENRSAKGSGSGSAIAVGDGLTEEVREVARFTASIGGWNVCWA